jgi:hypothetical protein
MTPRPRLLAAALALAALTACEKPAPLVTVVSGGESTYTEATVFCFEEGQTLQSEECAARSEDVPVLEVRAGEQVGVDVGKELVERGWRLELADPADPQSTQQSPVLDDHYFAFTAPGLRPDGELLLTVQTVDANGEAATGEWRFLLRPAS